MQQIINNNGSQEHAQLPTGLAAYDGFANYATLRVWEDIVGEYMIEELDDDEDMRSECLQMTLYDLAVYLKDSVDGVISDGGSLSDNFNASSGFAVSFARAFLEDVAWDELAVKFKQEVAAGAKRETAA